MSKRSLKRELRLAGADNSELDRLASIANQLRRLDKHRFAPSGAWLDWGAKLLIPAGLATILIVVTMAQSVTPASWLYPVQKSSDALAIRLNPAYRATVMMRSARQVNQLVTERASTKVILVSLSDYRAEAASYKAMPKINYSVFEYCKSQLAQAANKAPSDVRTAINTSLSQLKDT